MSSFVNSLLITLLAFLILATIRLLTILPPLRKRPSRARRRGSPTHLLIVLGSGGHTAEMLSMLENLDPRSYHHRTYIVGEGDTLSVKRAIHFEEMLKDEAHYGLSVGNGRLKDASGQDRYGSYIVLTVPRARKIHQSLITTPMSCLLTLTATLRVLSTSRERIMGPRVPAAPDLMLTNGPATSAIVILASLILRFFDFTGSGHARTRIIFIESFARISSLSLSAKCVWPMVDRLLVQWEGLKGKACGRAEHAGLMVRLGPDGG